MGLCTGARETNVDLALDDLTGVCFQHDLHLVVRDWASWTAIAARLAQAGANIQALHVARRAQEYSVFCRLERISDAAARQLTAAFVDEGVAERGSVEHLVLAKQYAGA